MSLQHSIVVNLRAVRFISIDSPLVTSSFARSSIINYVSFDVRDEDARIESLQRQKRRKIRYGGSGEPNHSLFDPHYLVS